jgi:hypothetical protein
MRQVYLGGTLINDVFLGDNRMDDVLQEEKLLPIDWLLVGGGASGGSRLNTGFGGGGGAGRFVTSSLGLIPSSSISVTIGAGGVSRTANTDFPGQDGGNSTATILGITYTAPGGGGGGNGKLGGNESSNGRNGGSGGGNGTFTTGSVTPGTAIAGSPIDGFGSNGLTALGGGSSAGGGASGTGGAGREWLDGVTYAVGGERIPATANTERGSGGFGANFNTNSGAGVAGVFIVRYPGATRATGGTITESDGYTYHTFTTNGTFTY